MKRELKTLIIISSIMVAFGLSVSIYFMAQPEPIDPIILETQVPELPVLSLEDPFSSNLPIIIINTFGQSIPNEPKIIANLKIIYNDSGGRNYITDTPVDYNISDFNGTIGIELRGYTSQRFYPKKQYNFETRNKNDPSEDISVPLLGFPEEEDWLLHGPYADKTLMRNYLAYNLSNQIGQYASKTKFVEVFVNTSGESLESQYKGVFVFLEKIKRSEYRVNVTELNSSHTAEPEITGGYIIKIDNLREDDDCFYTDRGTRLIYVYPRAEDMEDMPLQRAWIKNYMNEFESALYGPNFTDPVIGYEKYIDVDSFIDFFLLNEFLKAGDAYVCSTFMYKDRGGKLHMGPIWDFNGAMGNTDWRVPDWVVRYRNCWYDRLLKDNNFLNKVISRWDELKVTNFSKQNIFSMIDNISSLLNESQERNFLKWPILGRYVYPSKPPYPETYELEIKKLKGWFEDRITFIDNNINKLGNLTSIKHFPINNLLFFFPDDNPFLFIVLIIGMILGGLATLYICLKTNPKIGP